MEHVSEPQVMQDFMELPQWRRKSVILKCIEKPPENVHSWLFAVIRNFRTSELEKRLTGQASVHGHRSLPPPAMSIPPGGLPATGQPQTPCTTPCAVTSQPVLPVCTFDRSARQNGQPPRWSMELIAFWPTQKSRLVAHFLSMLQPATQGSLSTLVPQTQACIALAVALAADESTSPDEMAIQCVQRLQPGGIVGRGLLSGDGSAGPTAEVTQMQIIIVAPQSLVSLVFAKSFVVAMERLSPGAFSYLPLILVSLNDNRSLVEDAQRLKLSVNSSTTSLGALHEFIESSKDNFKTYKVKTLFVSMVHAATGVGECTPGQREAAALHGEGIRFLWTVAACSHHLRAAVGDVSVSELVFAPSILDETCKMELTKLVGPATSTANVSYNGVAAMPSVFATPGGSAVVKVCRASDYEMQAKDGWRLASEPTVSDNVRGGVINFLTKATEIAIFQEREWTPLEKQTIDDFTMTHDETGERRLCSRDWWLRWYGYAKTPLQTSLDTQHPCHSVIFAVTGSPAAADAPGSQPCGRLRLCGACEKALNVIDGAFCLPVMVDVAVALMVKAKQLWASGEQETAWARNADVNRVHSCGPSCPWAS